MHYVYVLKSDRTPRKYTGETDSVKRRLEEHNSADNTGWTRHFSPWELDAYVSCDTRETALIVEAFFKSPSGQEKYDRFAEANPEHPHPKQGFFDTLLEGRGFGRGENRFVVTKESNRTVFVMNG